MAALSSIQQFGSLFARVGPCVTGRNVFARSPRVGPHVLGAEPCLSVLALEFCAAGAPFSGVL